MLKPGAPVLAGVLCCALLPSLFAQKSDSPPAVPPPSLSLTLERKTIRENDKIPAEIWIANPSTVEFTDLGLTFYGPFWSESCEDSPAKSPDLKSLVLKNLGPGTTQHESLCLQSGSNLKIGDYTTSVVLEYSFLQEKQTRRAFVTSEVPISARLLGTDSVAGIPLGLATFIVPGLAFWMVLRLTRVPWGIDSGLGDQLIYSVLVSLVLVWGSSFVMEVEGGVGFQKLLWLALTGAGAGVIVSFFDHSIRRLRKAQLDSITPTPDDDEKTVLLKLFRRYSRMTQPEAQVRLRANGEEYFGSLGMRTPTFTVLVGWFQFGAKTQNHIAELKRLVGQKKFEEAMTFAKTNNIAIELRTGIQKRENATEASTGDAIRRWPTRDISEFEIRQATLRGDPVIVS